MIKHHCLAWVLGSTIPWTGPGLWIGLDSGLDSWIMAQFEICTRSFSEARLTGRCTSYSPSPICKSWILSTNASNFNGVTHDCEGHLTHLHHEIVNNSVSGGRRNVCLLFYIDPLSPGSWWGWSISLHNNVRWYKGIKVIQYSSYVLSVLPVPTVTMQCRC